MYGPTGGGKKFATNFHITFSAEFSRPPHPRFQCWYFEAREHNFLHQRGEVRLEKSSQPKSMLRSSNIEIWGSGGSIGCRSVCFNSIKGLKPHSQSRRLRTFFPSPVWRLGLYVTYTNVAITYTNKSERDRRHVCSRIIA